MTFLANGTYRACGCTLDDIKELYALEQQCFKKKDQFSKDNFRYLIKRGKGHFWSCRKEGDSRIMGYFYLTNRGRLYSICSRIPGQGAGSFMMDVVEQLCEKMNVQLHLEVSEFNTEAIRFYKKRGLEEYSLAEAYYSRDVDAILMRKPIKESV